MCMPVLRDAIVVLCMHTFTLCIGYNHYRLRMRECFDRINSNTVHSWGCFIKIHLAYFHIENVALNGIINKARYICANNDNMRDFLFKLPHDSTFNQQINA